MKDVRNEFPRNLAGVSAESLHPGPAYTRQMHKTLQREAAGLSNFIFPPLHNQRYFSFAHSVHAAFLSKLNGF